MAWEAVGCARGAYEVALRYATEREQFGRLIAKFQLVQDLLARMLGNAVMTELLDDLLGRSSLIALMYQSSHSAEASFAEHVAIVDALERRDRRAAIRLTESHLEHVERNLQLDPRSSDLSAILGARKR